MLSGNRPNCLSGGSIATKSMWHMAFVLPTSSMRLQTAAKRLPTPRRPFEATAKRRHNTPKRRKTGKRKQSLSGWIDQATTFYSNLLANADWVAAMASLNRDQTALEAEQAVIQALVDANLTQEKEKGESQEATRARDAKLEELYDWYGDYRDVAVVALDGHPEWIEMIRKGEVE